MASFPGKTRRGHEIHLTKAGKRKTFDSFFAPRQGLPRGVMAIRGEARVWERPGGALYAAAAPRARKKAFTAIPYALWQNRGPAEMRVWLRERLG